MSQATQTAASNIPAPDTGDRLDLTNIQGDILSGLPKKTETYYFFEITDPATFKTHMKRFIREIKTVKGVLKDREAIERHRKEHSKDGRKPPLIPLVGVNISFSHFGLAALEIDDGNLVDTAFLSGQRADAENLGDAGTGTGQDFVPDWEEPFRDLHIHGVILIAGDSHGTVIKKLREIEALFDVKGSSPSIKEVTTIVGDVRPGDVSAHEHFGFLDGISNPAVIGFDTRFHPGPVPVRPGAILVGRDGDSNEPNRDSWMIDGSFMVFRYLFQKVPEFDKFLEDNAIDSPGLTKEQGKELLGARLVGRWKSGAPVDITPFIDNPQLALDPTRNNNFHFAAERDFQKLCPFAAHIRKTLPRADLEASGISLESRRIMRRGIQFGPELTKQEKRERKTIHGRGLLFVCYQSSIVDAFQFIQKRWSNEPRFPPFERAPEEPGFDPIIGQGQSGRKLSGYHPDRPQDELLLPDELFVVPRGGEYFFSPSLKGLKEKFTA
ncbi:hypothetical protein AX16_003570 [Volvariella volvacea WC 439]|uniref:Dyp-type peroxidase n=1 Tax=Volvariella volvacea TaxID=36659 RepID=A0A0K1IK24_9AGAR|nr:Dyp-type peroxidase [Volvariella volvacea]KAF8654275.1 hypothetical protein AX16_003570 [Volvariella volvacea WC 439]